MGGMLREPQDSDMTAIAKESYPKVSGELGPLLERLNEIQVKNHEIANELSQRLEVIMVPPEPQPDSSDDGYEGRSFLGQKIESMIRDEMHLSEMLVDVLERLAL